MSRLVPSLLVVALAILATGCPDGRCKSATDFMYYYPQDRYVIAPTLTTPKGVKVDPSGGPVNLARVDRLFDEVDACLLAKFGASPRLSYETEKASSCVRSTFKLPISRSCFTVKVARDWRLSEDGSQQLLPVDAGHGCEAKGKKPPCFWRAMIVDPMQIVVPPSMYLLKDDVIRVVTGCLNPWATRELAACASPSTQGPLDNGTEP